MHDVMNRQQRRAAAKSGQLRSVLMTQFNNRGGALLELGRFDEAIESFDEALALKPRPSDAKIIFLNRGCTLMLLNRFSEALASYDNALSLQRDWPAVLCYRAHALRELRRFDEAIASYAAAQDHVSEGLIRLGIGDFEEGWSKLRTDNPPWPDEMSIQGKTILISSEQGYGDTIQLVRYVPLVAALGAARVILSVPKPLRHLFADVPGVSATVTESSTPDFDLSYSLFDLPLAFKTKLETIPAVIPYLRAPPGRNWDAMLGPRVRPRVGIAWSGNPGNTRDRNRSIALDLLSPLIDFDATWVSLQKDVRDNDRATLARLPIIDLTKSLENYADTAALISNVDLVISVDTSVAHLAGALGKPVWILLPFTPDWRWLLDRDDSPWYPTARLFRQSANRQWQDVIERVREALEGVVTQSLGGAGV
jgi:hypothetical protein